MRAAVLSVALIACAYRPGSFSHFRQGFPGQRTTVGCNDVSVERRPDLIGGGTVLAYEFGNRCDRAAVVDLSRATVIGRTYEGDERELSAFDPNHEIRPLKIDGRAVGKEAIAYPSNARLAEVCIDAASLAHEAPARWLCFASNLPGIIRDFHMTAVVALIPMAAKDCGSAYLDGAHDPQLIARQPMGFSIGRAVLTEDLRNLRATGGSHLPTG